MDVMIAYGCLEKRERWSRWSPAGGILFAPGRPGHSGERLGRGGGTLLGGAEYEWAWTIKAAEIPKLLAALNLKDDPLLGLKTRFSNENAADLGAFLDEHAISVERWSRVGD